VLLYSIGEKPFFAKTSSGHDPLDFPAVSTVDFVHDFERPTLIVK
jgi:hypothetical protein